jgi:hypothetical protein
MGILVLLMLLGVVIVLFRQKKFQAASALLIGVLIIVFSFTNNKIHDGYETVFYPRSRMFLGVPLLLGFFISLADIKFSRKRLFVFLLVPAVFFIIKCSMVTTAVNKNVYGVKYHNEYVSSISDLKTLCDTIRHAADKNNTDLVIVGNDVTKHLINYGCPCMEDRFPVTIEPLLDRRTWLLRPEMNSTRKSILFAGFIDVLIPSQMKNYPGVRRISENPLLFRLDSNSFSTKVLLDSLQLPARIW